MLCSWRSDSSVPNRCTFPDPNQRLTTPPRCICSRTGTLLLHGVNLGDGLSLLRVICLDVDLEVRHRNAEHLQQRGLVAVHDLTLLAYSVGGVKCDLALV